MSYGLLAALAIALLVAAYTDMRRRQIDNELNAIIALAAPLFWWASHMGLAEIGGNWRWRAGLLWFWRGCLPLGRWAAAMSNCWSRWPCGSNLCGLRNC
jgi:prepilin peptidase CpaA